MSDKDKKSTFQKIQKGIDLAKGIYVYGGLAAAQAGLYAMFDRRFSSFEKAQDSFDWLLYKTRTDYPSLAVREVVHFPSPPNLLTGYLYKVKDPVALLICVHGIFSQSDGNAAAYHDYFLRHGYDILAIDLTASGRSEGVGVDGLQQSAIDVHQAIEFVRGRADLKDLPLCLLGHSWGAYGVSAVGNFDQNMVAVCEMSGFSTPDQIMYSVVKNRASLAADLTKWHLDETLKSRGGDLAFLSALDGIDKAKDTHFLLIHGSDDDVINIKDASIYGAAATLKNRNIERLLQKGKKHEGIWYTVAAEKYAEQFKKAHSDLIKQYKKWDAVPEDVKEPFLNLLDKEKASEVDEKMLSAIDKFFRKSLRDRR